MATTPSEWSTAIGGGGLSERGRKDDKKGRWAERERERERESEREREKETYVRVLQFSARDRRHLIDVRERRAVDSAHLREERVVGVVHLRDGKRLDHLIQMVQTLHEGGTHRGVVRPAACHERGEGGCKTPHGQKWASD
jgi:hypothetical protein